MDPSRTKEFIEELKGRIDPSSSAYESHILRRFSFIPPSGDDLRIPIPPMKRTKGIEGTTIQKKMGCSTSIDKGIIKSRKEF
ncbi:hypothetical protein HAX54_031889 [Datura stramonium]|uniref:Uncharacterized protein n=1 Tax=Datura stramonium TaxID=4076 RepID=A0ABS8VBW5_DATST|nr:hypothetical protein [Datura stramonium]